MMIRAFRVGAEMTHDVKIRMEIRNRAARVKPVQGAAAGFRRGIDKLGQIHHPHAVSEVINNLHKDLLSDKSALKKASSGCPQHAAFYFMKRLGNHRLMPGIKVIRRSVAIMQR